MLAGRRKAVDPLPHIQTQTYAPVYTKPNHVYHNSPLPDSPIQDSPIQDSSIQDSPFSRTPPFPGLAPSRTTPIQDSPLQAHTQIHTHTRAVSFCFFQCSCNFVPTTAGYKRVEPKNSQSKDNLDYLLVRVASNLVCDRIGKRLRMRLRRAQCTPHCLVLYKKYI